MELLHPGGVRASSSKMITLVSRRVALSRLASRAFVTKEVQKVNQGNKKRTKKKKKKRAPRNLETASTDVYLCCDTNLIACLIKDDVRGFPEYFQRILNDYPGELCYVCDHVHVI